MATPTITIRMSDDEKRFITAYAEMKGITLSGFLREAALSRIEDDLDLKAWDLAKKEFDTDAIVYTAEEIEKKYL